MRILHIWDQAGVACVLAKYQQILGYDSKVILISNRDKYGIHKFYKDHIILVNSEAFTDRCIEESTSADVIHIHSLHRLVFRLRRNFGRTKKIILHYHGTELRGFRIKILYNEGLKKFAKSTIDRAYQLAFLSRQTHRRAQLLSDAILVDGPDLLYFLEHGICLPIPVDTDHFRPDTLKENRIGMKEALTIDNTRIDVQMALDYCKKNNIRLDIDVHDRTKCPVMYNDMPEFLKNYEIYVDLRFVEGKLLDHLSTTAEQSLASGLKVLDFELKYRHGLPAEMEGKNVASKLLGIYNTSSRLVY